MLILSRKIGQRIIIGADVVVTIVEMRADKCRVGIEAPDDVLVDREEVRIARDRENRNGRDAEERGRLA